MNTLVAVIRKFPEHELALRRLYASDNEFRTLCEDLSLAASAISRWQDDRTRTEEYRLLVGEMENEILEFIEGRHPRQIARNIRK